MVYTHGEFDYSKINENIEKLYISTNLNLNQITSEKSLEDQIKSFFKNKFSNLLIVSVDLKFKENTKEILFLLNYIISKVQKKCYIKE